MDVEGLDAEQRVTQTLLNIPGITVKPAGKRSQSHDLEVSDSNGAFARIPGVIPGRYEVKALWRKREGRAFDPRFKVGQRGERIYGVRDSLIKAFAALKNQVDHILEHAVSHPSYGQTKDELIQFVEQAHGFIEQAVLRRHSKSFAARLERLARVSQYIPTMLPIARQALYNRIQASDIVGGFSDIEGVFVVAGPNYTLVTRDEIPEFLAFDSVSSEGLKLRYTQKIPTDKHVTKITTREG